MSLSSINEQLIYSIRETGQYIRSNFYTSHPGTSICKFTNSSHIGLSLNTVLRIKEALKNDPN